MLFFKQTAKYKNPDTNRCTRIPHNLYRQNKRASRCSPFLSSVVPRTGIEPARLAALVFETNASTYSAIWVNSIFCDAKVLIKVESRKP